MNNIDEVNVALRRLTRASYLYSRHMLKTTGLTTPQILILRTIRDLGEVNPTPGDLARAISLSQATLTSILDRMEKHQLVYRKRSEVDRRKVYVYLDKVGHEVLETSPMPLQGRFTEAFNELADWEQAMLVSALQRVAGMMEGSERAERPSRADSNAIALLVDGAEVAHVAASPEAAALLTDVVNAADEDLPPSRDSALSEGP